MSACAKSALKGLSREVLTAAKAMFNAAGAALKILQAQKEAMALSLKISLVPLQVKKAVLDTIVADVRNVARIIPGSAVALCPDLGSVNIMLQKSIGGQFEGALNAVAEIDAQLSIAAEVDADIIEMKNAIAFFDELSATIDEVLKES